jgi:ketosteroid isomerase-like protein
MGATVRTCVCLLILSASLAGCAAIATAPVATPVPEAIVPEIAKQFSACKLDALVENYSSSIEFVSPSTPKPLFGHSAIRQYFSGACTGQSRPVMRVEAQRVQVLSPESAVITGSYSFGRTDRPNEKPWPAFFVITLKREMGRWLINTQATFPVPEG